MEINGAPLNGGDEGRSPFEDRSGADEISLNGGGAPPSDADPGGGAPAPARAPSTTATAPARSLSMSMAAQQAAALAEVEARVEEEDAEQPHLFRRGEPDGDGGSGGLGGERTRGGGCGPTQLWRAVAGSLRRLLRTLLDTAAHFVVFVTLAHGSWLSFFTVATAVGFTAFYTLYDGGSMAAKLDWQFVSFALVFPVTFFLAETWRRRERGLAKMAGIKSLSLWLYLAHRDWLHSDKLPEGHLDTVKTVLVKMLCDLHGYITLRRLTTRDLYFAVGKNHRFLEFEDKRRQWRRGMYIQMKLLSRLCEALKDCGLPTNEASRINQYHSLLLKDVEEVMNIKDYRTPQGIRSFTRVYVILIWTMFGSYYAWVAQQTGSLAFAICLAATSSLALVGLIKVSMTMEDPFESVGVDDVRTSRDLAEVIFAIKDDSLEDSLKLLANDTDLSLDQIEEEGEEPLSPNKLNKGSLFPVWSAHQQEKLQGKILRQSPRAAAPHPRLASPTNTTSAGNTA
eukprot:jgi/Tetstr1/457199/TSEL_043847.t1